MIESAFSTSSPTPSFSRRSVRVRHSRAIWRTMLSSISSPSGVVAWPLSRIRMRSAIRLRWSMMLLRRTSVGCAVRTGATSARSSTSITCSRVTPAWTNSSSASAKDMRVSVITPSRSSARLASIEKRPKPRTKESVWSRSSLSRPSSGTLSPRCRPTLADRMRSVRSNRSCPPCCRMTSPSNLPRKRISGFCWMAGRDEFIRVRSRKRRLRRIGRVADGRSA